MDCKVYLDPYCMWLSALPALINRLHDLFDSGQNVRVVRDDSGEDRHGYLEYQVDGVWGAVCAATMDTNSVTVACRQLGFTGGRLYRPSITTYKQVLGHDSSHCFASTLRQTGSKTAFLNRFCVLHLLHPLSVLSHRVDYSDTGFNRANRKTVLKSISIA